jgi:acyl-CoA synthetase (AMP-forming)/AMP-acid ligase II
VLISFLAALRLGVVPTIFPYLTERMSRDAYWRRVRSAALEFGARAVVTDDASRADAASALTGLACVVASTAARSNPAVEASPRPDDVALLQCTSGTTGTPKAVMITHGAVLAHVDAHVAAFDIVPDDVVVSWLPLHHDMGLISSVVLPLATGLHTVVMSPFHWVREPWSLFRAIHEFRGTLCWVPNFALDHSLKTIRDRHLDGVDLRSLRSFVNGSEPVRADSMARFLDRFVPFGLAATALRSGYGMAEIVLGASVTPLRRCPTIDRVSQRDLQRGDATPAGPDDCGATTIVSAGKPLAGVTVEVRDERGGTLPDRRVGEIALRAPYLAAGYHRRPDLSAAAFRDGWFLTGDLGYLADGEIFVCGRRKDCVIVAGRNLFPEDVETVANGVRGIHPGRVAAFGVPDDRLGTERMVIVYEAADESDARDVERELRRRVLQEVDVALADVRRVERGWIVKTTNGKVARGVCRDRYLRDGGA